MISHKLVFVILSRAALYVAASFILFRLGLFTLNTCKSSVIALTGNLLLQAVVLYYDL